MWRRDSKVFCGRVDRRRRRRRRRSSIRAKVKLTFLLSLSLSLISANKWHLMRNSLCEMNWWHARDNDMHKVSSPVVSRCTRRCNSTHSDALHVVLGKKKKKSLSSRNSASLKKSPEEVEKSCMLVYLWPGIHLGKLLLWAQINKWTILDLNN